MPAEAEERGSARRLVPHWERGLCFGPQGRKGGATEEEVALAKIKTVQSKRKGGACRRKTKRSTRSRRALGSGR